MKMFTEIAHTVRRVETTYPPIVVDSWWTLSGCREPRGEREISLFKSGPHESIYTNQHERLYDITPEITADATRCRQIVVS